MEEKYYLYVSRDCGSKYRQEAIGTLSDLENKGKDYDKESLRWYINKEDEEGNQVQVEVSAIHKQIINAFKRIQ